MSSQLLTKFRSVIQNKSNLPITQSRSIGSAKKKAKKDNKCPNKTCGEPPQPKKSFWNIFRASEEPSEVIPPRESCRKLIAKQGCQPDPDFSGIGGSPYRTAGSAYLIQKDMAKQPLAANEPEDKLLDKMERHPSLKDMEDPMPPFESVEQRLLKLCELGLHPDYKRCMHVPRSTVDLSLPKHLYKSRSGPIADDEYPPHLKVSKECLGRKNVFAEFKRAEPPRQLLAKMLEIKQNEKPTLGANINSAVPSKNEKSCKGEKEKVKG